MTGYRLVLASPWLFLYTWCIMFARNIIERKKISPTPRSSQTTLHTHWQSGVTSEGSLLVYQFFRSWVSYHISEYPLSLIPPPPLPLRRKGPRGEANIHSDWMPNAESLKYRSSQECISAKVCQLVTPKSPKFNHFLVVMSSQRNSSRAVGYLLPWKPLMLKLQYGTLCNIYCWMNFERKNFVYSHSYAFM